jgi:hypothetical protein
MALRTSVKGIAASVAATRASTRARDSGGILRLSSDHFRAFI